MALSANPEFIVQPPLRDLKDDVLSAKLDVEEKELVMDLNSESLSIKPEAEDNESARDLNKEVCSARLDAEPTEVLRIRERPLMNEPNILNASVRDLKNELFSLVRHAHRLADPGVQLARHRNRGLGQRGVPRGNQPYLVTIHNAEQRLTARAHGEALDLRTGKTHRACQRPKQRISPSDSGC